MKELNIPPLTNISKQEAIEKVENWLKRLGLKVSKKDLERPWGAFWYIKPERISLFLSLFFPKVKEEIKLDISPKILLISPKESLSWQYHQRRNEIWKILNTVGVLLNNTDDIPSKEQIKIKNRGEIIDIPASKRHRAIGLENSYGLIAEIWEHLNPKNPSNEEDNTRIQDNYGRN